MTELEGERILDQVIHLVADVLDVPPAGLAVDTGAADIEAWDSFGHVRIVLALEAAFGVTMSMAEIERSDSIRGLLATVAAARLRRTTGAAAQ